MRKWFIFIFFTIVSGSCLLAQGNGLEVKGTGTGLFLEHTVLPKESFYSIGRMYNVAPKELASFNHLSFETGLTIGFALKIPLDKNNFSQTGTAVKGQVLVPVYHTVEPGETLYRLGVNYNKVPLSFIQNWNHLPSDAVPEGSPMIIGFLKVDKSQSSLSNMDNKPAADVAASSIGEKKPEVATEKAVVHDTASVTSEAKEAGAVKEANSTVTSSNTKSNINFSGGYFKQLYDQQVESTPPVSNNGSAGIFKSTSGWQDGKYYCFNNDATPGTVLKVTDNATGKSVYAKVLDAIPDIKQNAGLSLVLSNAAAEELGNGMNNKFDCVVSYIK